MNSCDIYGNNVFLHGSTGVTIDNSYISAGANNAYGAAVTQEPRYGYMSITSGGSVNITESSLYGYDLNIAAGKAINISEVSLNYFSTLSLAAKTIVLDDVSFANGAIVNLSCSSGHLAPNPNTGACAFV